MALRAEVGREHLGKDKKNYFLRIYIMSHTYVYIHTHISMYRYKANLIALCFTLLHFTADSAFFIK